MKKLYFILFLALCSNLIFGQSKYHIYASAAGDTILWSFNGAIVHSETDFLNLRHPLKPQAYIVALSERWIFIDPTHHACSGERSGSLI